MEQREVLFFFSGKRGGGWYNGRRSNSGTSYYPADGGPCQGVAIGNRMNFHPAGHSLEVFAGTAVFGRRLAVPRSCPAASEKNLHLRFGRDVVANGVLLGRKLEMMGRTTTPFAQRVWTSSFTSLSPASFLLAAFDW
jgi:hypothetical protein